MKTILKTIIILLLLSSCGTRKVSNKQTAFKSDSLIIENKHVLSQEIILNDIFTLKPFDTLKPMIIDGKSYFNVVITNDKSKINKIEDKVENKVSSVKKESETKIKESEKTDNTLLYIGLFLVLCLFVFLWFYLKRTSVFNFRN
jgi:hypothetical protein